MCVCIDVCHVSAGGVMFQQVWLETVSNPTTKVCIGVCHVSAGVCHVSAGVCHVSASVAGDSVQPHY